MKRVDECVVLASVPGGDGRSEKRRGDVRELFYESLSKSINQDGGGSSILYCRTVAFGTTNASMISSISSTGR